MLALKKTQFIKKNLFIRIFSTQQNFDNLNTQENSKDLSSIQSVVSNVESQQFNRNYELICFLNKSIENSFQETLHLVDHISEHIKSKPQLHDKESALRQEMIDSVEKIQMDISIKIQKLANSVTKKCKSAVRKYNSGREKIYTKDIANTAKQKKN